MTTETNPTEINRYLATEVMGVHCWHKPYKITIDHPEHGEYDAMRCKECGQVNSMSMAEQYLSNPDYLTNLSDRQDLLGWAMKQKWWYPFLCQDEPFGDDITMMLRHISLLIPKEALATAIYRYRIKLEATSPSSGS